MDRENHMLNGGETRHAGSENAIRLRGPTHSLWRGAAALLLVISGCAEHTDQSKHNASLTNAELDTANEFAEVGVIAAHDENDEPMWYCTATLIGSTPGSSAPDILLTASHCIIDYGKVVWPELYFYPADKAGGITYPCTPEGGSDCAVRVTAAFAHPEYDYGGVNYFCDGVPSKDVAIAFLERGIDGVDPARIQADIPSDQSPVTLAGYGDNEDEGHCTTDEHCSEGYTCERDRDESGGLAPVGYCKSSQMTRRKGPNELLLCGEAAANWGGDPTTGFMMSGSRTSDATRDFAGTCFGDSGGPVFVDDRVIVGVNALVAGGIDLCRSVGYGAATYGPNYEWLQGAIDAFAECDCETVVRVPPQPGWNYFHGTSANECIIGTPGPDFIWGGGGNDCIWGHDGRDRIWGEDGNDQIWGEAGDDVLGGGPGDDKLHGGEGEADRALGEDGDDFCDAEDVAEEYGCESVPETEEPTE